MKTVRLDLRVGIIVLATAAIAVLAFAQAPNSKPDQGKSNRAIPLTLPVLAARIDRLNDQVKALKEKVQTLETRLSAAEVKNAAQDAKNTAQDQKNADQDARIAKKADLIHPEGYSGMWCTKYIFENTLDKNNTMLHVYVKN